jgi:hypothetical protein
MVSKRNTHNFDVVVVGGGAAGIAAAIGAAQAGASVCLIEQYGFLGGAATVSSVLAYCGFFDQTKTQVVKGVGQCFLDRLHERSLYRTETFTGSGNTVVLLDMETTKTVFDEMVTAAGVALFLHSHVVSSTVEGNRMTEVELSHRGGRERVRGRAFVDCSGDGVLLASPESATQVSPVAERQASTLVMRVGGVAEDADMSVEGMAAAVHKFQQQSGITLTRESGTAVRMPISREVMLLLADQHRDVLDIRDLTAAEVEARQSCWHYFDAFRKFLRGWEASFLAATGPQLGIRESRRLRGRDTVRAEDVVTGRKRPTDAIARCGWPMEDHVVPGVTAYGGIQDQGWYDIPYGSICSASTDNLWAAGRLVSSDNQAYASLRVMGTAFATGHAGGVAAAIHSSTGSHDLRETRVQLSRQGALI